ncbi:probable E3 ubiquitin-protein ligase TRIML1 [Ornithorhynchus anatinus]|uniref:probable E3 ubiquitin-protein ligase TRIML1 n=1 Tax=Ornithorhynchus anatinus TaxID=9258 RepID=UPI0019D4751A|nr:probable E3 ubiquitin-protein ligase TRIML1 [Ornithorhynchus anatinus]
MDLANDLQEELTCSVCMDYFIDPVTISCGHSFCHLCLLKCWEDTQTCFSCPECRGGCELKDFQINLRLKKLAIIGKQLRPRLLKNSIGGGLCGWHQQDLKLFCQQDGSPICMSCFNSEAHRHHSVYPIEDSADFYRVSCLSYADNILRQDKIGCKRNVVQEFSHAAAVARSLLFEAECVLCPWDKGNAQQICSLWNIIRIICVTLPKLLIFSAVDVTLDPNTASPYVIVSQDRRSVRIAETPPDVPNHQNRFDNCTSVLGSQAFTTGRHYWEVEVGDKPEWEVAVSYEFRGQKHRMRFLQEEAFSLFSTHSGNGDGPCVTFPGSRVPVRRVGVFLDYEAGILSFYNVTESYLIYSFLPTRFFGPVRPIFSPCLRYGQHDQEPITICPVNNIIL